MRTALITTTINVPRVLKLYRKFGPDVQFFVAADEKTPRHAYEFCADIPKCEIYSPERQRELGYECSALIGWNCVQRRNIALLEAVKWGAEVIVTIDDDNAALDVGYFNHIRWTFMRPYSGLEAQSLSGWFDPGCLLVPQTKHRGFPIAIKSEPVFESIVDAKIGVVAGLCLGDPDVDSITRIATAPVIHSVSELARAGVAVNIFCKTVFNSQNTAFIRELAPAMFMMPGIGRYDDIYASLICQRVMRERGLHVHFDQPFVWQQRNQHNLLGDLRAEIDGMEHIVEFAQFLDDVPATFFLQGPCIPTLRETYQAAKEEHYLPALSLEAALAFLNDIEKIL